SLALCHCPFHVLHYPPDLPSFPTRRSSDLCEVLERSTTRSVSRSYVLILMVLTTTVMTALTVMVVTVAMAAVLLLQHRSRHQHRSEEHTSELQSRFDLVCRLLLEKKKINEE